MANPHRGGSITLQLVRRIVFSMVSTLNRDERGSLGSTWIKGARSLESHNSLAPKEQYKSEVQA